jgi:plastocyanin
MQNGIFVNDADEVTVDGFMARGYKSNGFFFTNLTGYSMNHLIARQTGVYGLYAFNTKGGSMTNSLGYYQRDGAYYVGQTPEQTKPKRTVIKNVVGWGSVLGFSGSNMRYVTISDSKFFNNGVGIAPNAIDSEKFPPEEDNVIRDNDIFWNNFDAYKKAPFRATAQADFVYPPGSGIVLLSGRRNLVENNRFWGNQLGAFISVQNIFLKNPETIDLIDNVVRGNAFGKDGTDKNGRDLVYTGNGRGNCFENNTGVETMLPADPANFPACPGPDNPDTQEAITLMFEAGVNKKYRENWITTARSPIQGIEPLVDYEAGKQYGPLQLDPIAGTSSIATASAVTARAAHAPKSVQVADFFLAPGNLTVKKDTLVTWKWSADNTDTHDVKLKKAPAGVKKWSSAIAATDYTFKRRLTKRGKYVVICSLHPDTMEQKITVR